MGVGNRRIANISHGTCDRARSCEGAAELAHLWDAVDDFLELGIEQTRQNALS